MFLFYRFHTGKSKVPHILAAKLLSPLAEREFFLCPNAKLRGHMRIAQARSHF